jgi:hypothetical protein
MSLFKGMLVAVSVLSLAGCSSVCSTKPVGEKAVAVEPEEWEGTWINSEMDTPVSIKVTDAKKGILKAMWIDKMKMESCDFQLLESGTWMFGSMRKDDKDNRYLWGRIKKDAGQIIVWIPDVTKIRELVKAGTLTGTVAEDGDVTLGDLNAAQLSVITSEDKGLLFEWTNPLILIRLSK